MSGDADRPIDWTLPEGGPAIFENRRPLSDKLVAEIAAKLAKALNGSSPMKFTFGNAGDSYIGPLENPELAANFALHEILHITGYARSIGVGIEIEYDHGREIYISDIGRDRSSDETKGNGAKVIQHVCDLADLLKVCVCISHMTNEPGLGAYYARFGFVPEAEPEHITNMRREPRPR